MKLDEYQTLAKGTKVAEGLMYTGLALAGEAGEVANEIKKYHRDDKEVLTPERKQKILLELGDVLWYVSSLADDLGETLETVALRNLAKLRRRQEMAATPTPTENTEKKGRLVR